jgi:heme oxygenase
MKIRTNYVSNSSSSSFLVICHNKEYDFIKFKEFNGYDVFMKDIQVTNEKEAKEFIASFLMNHYYHEHMKYLKKKLPDINLDDLSYIDYLFEISGIDDSKYWNIIQETNRIGSNFWIENEDNLETNKILNEIRKYEDSYYENKDNKCKITEIANEIFDNLKSKGVFVEFIRYEDDTKQGAYMEQGFMPFLNANPEKNYCIISCSEH